MISASLVDRPKDIADIRAMLLAQRGRLDLARIRADASQLLTGSAQGELEALLAACGD